MLPIFLLICACAFREALSDTDTVQHPLTGIPQQGQNLSQSAVASIPPTPPEASSKSAYVTMNGHTNFQTTQFFYLTGIDQLLRENDGAPTKNKEETKVRDDYVVTQNVGVHKLHRQKLTWNNARQQCILEGGHLAVINSNKEEAVLLEMMSKENLAAAWLGLHDLYEEGVWTTILDEPLAATGYTKWTPAIPADPDNYGGNQNCAVLIKQTGMDDIECESKQAFLCELACV